MPRPGVVLGLVGTNGIGKSTALKILAGKQKPNLGKFGVSWVAEGRGEEEGQEMRSCFSFSEPTRLAGDFDVLSRFRVAELLHQDFGR